MEDEQNECIKKLLGVIQEMKRKNAVVAIDTPDMGNTVGRTNGMLEGKETSHQLVGGETEEEVSSLGTGLTTFGGGTVQGPTFHIVWQQKSIPILQILVDYKGCSSRECTCSLFQRQLVGGLPTA